MKLQTRDIEILKFVSKFGYVNSVHIQKLFDIKQSRSSQLINRLINDNYLKKEQILAKEPAIYYLTSKGAELVKTNRVKKITLQNLKHNLLVTDVYIDLIKQNPELEILSDKEQRAGKFGKMANLGVPDLLILTDEQNGKKNIAIEVELSRKNKERLNKILSKRSREYLETQYYCNASTYEHLSREAKLKSNVKVYSYFDYEEIPEEIAEVLSNIKKPSTTETPSKNLDIKIVKLENEKQMIAKDLETLRFKADKVKKAFDNVEFKSGMFGNVTAKADDLEVLKKLLRSL